MRPGASLAFVAIVAACAPVGTGSSAVVVRNTCSATSDCAAYKQISGALKCSDTNVCQARAALDLTFVMTLPDGAVYAPGHTFVAKLASLPNGRGCPPAPGCVTRALPSLGEFAGVYTATTGVQSTANFYLGTGVRSLPTQPTFRHAWSFVDGALPIDMDLLGMTLQPLVAAHVLNDEQLYPSPSLTDKNVAAPSIGFDILLPAGQYEETLAPVWPFSVAFPPIVSQGATPRPGPLAKRDPNDFQNAALGGGSSGPSLTANAHFVTVTRGAGLSLAGWTLLLRDSLTKRAISSAPRLTTADRVTLFTVNQLAPSDSGKGETIRDAVELVLSPPADESPRLPELVLPALANRVPPVAPYPLLPFQALVDGIVLADDGGGVQSDVVLVSQEIAMLDSELSASDVSFVDHFSTNAGGLFTRSLPPGKYTAIVSPPLATGLGKTISVLDVGTPTAPGQHQGRKTLRLARPDLLRGTVRVADGRVMPDAEVEAHPAALLPYSVDLDARDPRRWPRIVRTRTNGAGDFVLPVDPGGTFDVVVRPPAGTGFPWVVIQTVTSPSADLALEIPAPVVVSATLQDPSGLPAAQAFIQAYVGVPSAIPGAQCTLDNDALQPKRDGTCPANTPRCLSGRCFAVVGLEIGRTRTDDLGRFTLFVDGTPR